MSTDTMGGEAHGLVIPPPLEGAGLELRPVLSDDTEALYEIAIDPRVSTRIRFRGATPSPVEFAASMFESVLAQFGIFIGQHEDPVGAVLLTSPSFIDGHARLSAFVRHDLIHSGIGFRASLLTINYAFATWPFRKLYLDIPEFNYRDSWNVDGRLMTEEGRLREHSYFEGRFWDLLFMAVYRADAASTVGPRVAKWQTAESSETAAESVSPSD